MMNKVRLEALSDGVFSIVMTLLIIDIKVPHLNDTGSVREMVDTLWAMWPLFRSFYLSFMLLGMYWISHHAFFHMYAKHTNRVVTLLNILYLCFISLVPFSTHLIGEYPTNQVAVSVYGMNVVLIGLIQFWMIRIVIHDQEMRHETLTQRLIIQGTIRVLMPPAFAVLGMMASFHHSSLSFFLFAFPVVFNIVPGTLNALEYAYNKVFKRRAA